MTLRRDIARTMLFQCFALGAGVITNMVVARTIGPAGKGLLSFFGYLLFIAINLGGLGMQASAIQQIGKKRFSPETVAWTQILLAIAAGAVCALLLAFLLPLYRGRMSLAPELLPPFLVVVVFSLLWLNLSGVIIGLGRIRAANWIEALTPAVWMPAAVVVLWFFRGSSSSGALAWMAAQLFAPLAALFWLARNHPSRPTVSGPCIRESLRFGSGAYLANLIWTLLLRADGLLLAYLLGASAVGIYSVAVLLAELLWYLPRALNLSLNPRVASGTQEDAMQLSLRAARTGIWCVAGASLALVILGRPLLRLAFGPAFQASYAPLLVLLPAVLFGALASPLSLYFTQQQSRPLISAQCGAPALFLNLGLNLLWIPRFGPVGASGASLVAYGVLAALLALRFRREPGFSWARLLRPGREDLHPFREILSRLGRDAR